MSGVRLSRGQHLTPAKKEMEETGRANRIICIVDLYPYVSKISNDFLMSRCLYTQVNMKFQLMDNWVRTVHFFDFYDLHCLYFFVTPPVEEIIMMIKDFAYEHNMEEGNTFQIIVGKKERDPSEPPQFLLLEKSLRDQLFDYVMICYVGDLTVSCLNCHKQLLYMDWNTQHHHAIREILNLFCDSDDFVFNFIACLDTPCLKNK